MSFKQKSRPKHSWRATRDQQHPSSILSTDLSGILCNFPIKTLQNTISLSGVNCKPFVSVIVIWIICYSMSRFQCQGSPSEVLIIKESNLFNKSLYIFLPLAHSYFLNKKCLITIKNKHQLYLKFPCFVCV